MGVKLVIFLAATVFVGVCAEFTKEQKDYLNTIFVNVKPEERKETLINILYMGYVIKHPIPPNFTLPADDMVKVYDLVVENTKIMNELPPFLKSKICFPDGECVDPDDHGIYPLI
ncbi:hypothetical protein JTB14_018849 [Gonioctena quinquepunctata]|nr:hypothetical protein JTB14_018849 [Gonioctena quinquepunctata]